MPPNAQSSSQAPTSAEIAELYSMLHIDSAAPFADALAAIELLVAADATKTGVSSLSAGELAACRAVGCRPADFARIKAQRAAQGGGR